MNPERMTYSSNRILPNFNPDLAFKTLLHPLESVAGAVRQIHI